MTRNVSIARAVRRALITSAVAAISAAGTPAFAQDQDQDNTQTVVVTGSRIQNQDYQANSPLTTVSGEQVMKNQDVTLDTFLNTLPQVNPSGTTTSNNPGNNGQANIDLRGLGANRNLVLIDGRRAMPSASDLTVDLNTIPESMIENIEIITGGAGAVYGADAVAGVVNVKLKDNFQGFDLSAGYSDSTENWDSREYNLSATMGANFAEDRGNAIISFEYANREGLIKSQRDFAALATATTTFNPEGLYFPSGSAPNQNLVNAYFAQFGAPAGSVTAGGNFIGFNLDGSMFSRGAFNNPSDVVNFKYPVDLAVNTAIFPDVYSYNFDAVNLLVSPLERRGMMSKFHYDLTDNVEVFTQFAYTNYSAQNALAPTPIPTITIAAPGEQRSAGEASSEFLLPGKRIANLLIIPYDNFFLQQPQLADFRNLLLSRTVANTNFDGQANPATQPILMRQRTLDAGLRSSGFDNTVTQYLLGLRGKLAGDWRWEAFAQEGRTVIDQFQSGNIDTQKLLGLLANTTDGGDSTCEGGFNPFGRQPISQECRDYLEVSNTLTYEFKQQIVQGYLTGPVAEMPAGTLSAVLGAEYRGFRYNLDPGSAGGPISGFNVQDPAGGTNRFEDLFTEFFIPLMKDAPGAQALDLSLGYRYSSSVFKNIVGGTEGEEQHNSAYKAEVSWLPVDAIRVRASYQRAVRAPNFNELFDGGGSNPQYYDPCSATGVARNGPSGAQLLALCRTAGALGAAGWGGDAYVQTPGTQISTTLGSNLDLQPEKADTMTLGLVWQPQDGFLSKLRTSVDYYRIEVKDALVQPDANLYVADCYNFYGRNPNYSASYVNCPGIFRSGDILGVDNPLDPDGFFQFQNDGEIMTDGIDIQLNWLGTDIGPGVLTGTVLMNYLLSWEQQATSDLPKQDFAGTITFFGAGDGLGQTFPELRATVAAQYKIGPVAADVRARYIDKMDNRAAVLYPGETFAGVGSVVYWDVGATWEFVENSTFRLGLNNVLDKQPPQYQPNVQSGTDPSTYDVLGRRVFARVDMKF